MFISVEKFSSWIQCMNMSRYTCTTATNLPKYIRGRKGGFPWTVNATVVLIKVLFRGVALSLKGVKSTAKNTTHFFQLRSVTKPLLFHNMLTVHVHIYHLTVDIYVRSREFIILYRVFLIVSLYCIPFWSWMNS